MFKKQKQYFKKLHVNKINCKLFLIIKNIFKENYNSYIDILNYDLLLIITQLLLFTLIPWQILHKCIA